MSFAYEFVKELKQRNVDFELLLYLDLLPEMKEVVGTGESEELEESNEIYAVWNLKNNIPDVLSLNVKRVGIIFSYYEGAVIVLDIYSNKTIKILQNDAGKYSEEMLDMIKTIAIERGYKIKRRRKSEKK